MSAVQLFNFKSQQIRVVEIDGAPWLVAKDIPEVLGYTYDNLWYHIKNNLGATEKTVVKLPGFRGNGGVVVSESGLYKLVMRSDKPEAKAFQDWVTKAVLPAIRKDGGYIMGEEKVATGEMSEDELILKAMGILQRKVERLTAENAAMRQELDVITVDEFRALKHLYLAQGQSRATISKSTTDDACGKSVW